MVETLSLNFRVFTVKLVGVLEFKKLHSYHYVNVYVLIKFSEKTSVFTLIFISSP